MICNGQVYSLDGTIRMVANVKEWADGRLRGTVNYQGSILATNLATGASGQVGGRMGNLPMPGFARTG